MTGTEPELPASVRILRAGAALFCRLGYTATTMRDIATEVGMSKAGLYHHYQRKEDLLADVAQHGAQALKDHLEQVRAMDGTPLERLRAFVRTRMVAIAENQDMLTVIWQERPAIDQGIFARIADDLRDYRHGMLGLIEAARSGGYIRGDVDPQVLMRAIDGMTGWSYIWLGDRQRASAADIGEQFWQILFSGVRAV